MIVNLLAATAATQAETEDDSSDDNNEEAWHGVDVRAGDLDIVQNTLACLLYTSPSPRDVEESRMPSSA